jgi:hypothetical protein
MELGGFNEGKEGILERCEDEIAGKWEKRLFKIHEGSLKCYEKV